MERSDTYKMIAARLNMGDKPSSAQDLEVGDWVQWISGGQIEAYGAIRRISGNKVVIASAEGMVTAPVSELKFIRKAR